MKRRGRPPYPELLTPREQQVLALLREGLSNEQIADRLGVSLAGAKYHVSEILSKLGVASREEAARWEPGGRAWWARGLAPPALLWSRLSAPWLARGAIAVVAVGLAAGAGLLLWGLLRTNGGESRNTSILATQSSAPFCSVDFPQSWQSALTEGRIPLPAADYFYAAAVDADATQVFGALHSDDWSGVVAVDRRGVITRIRPFDKPDVDSIWNAAFDGRWLVWTESHSPGTPGANDLRAWDSSTNEGFDLAHESVGVFPPVIAQGRLAWAVPQHSLLETYDLHLYSLVERHDRVVSSEEFRQPVLFSGSKLLLFESHTPTGGQFRMVDAATGELLPIPKLFGSIASATVSASNDLFAWSDGRSVLASQVGESVPLQIYTASSRDIAGFVSIGGDIVKWEVQSASGNYLPTMVADLRSGSFTSLPEGYGGFYANSGAIALQKPLGPITKNGDERHVTLNHFETNLVNTADLPPLPACSG